jgi:hypothetical protein
MEYTVEMGSGVTVYIPSFINSGTGIQKLIRGIHRHTDRIEIAQAFCTKVGKKLDKNYTQNTSKL